MRKYYIDNIRIFCILLLIPYHTAMIFNNFGESWYIHSQNNTLATLFIIGVYPWWMSVLFVLAGMSTVYALKKRTPRQYAKERFQKLLIPMVSAIVLLVPVQTYLADKFFHNYPGSYFDHFSIFFSLTDWSGYDGHFTPAHTWFILFLFIISMISLPLMSWYNKKEHKRNSTEMNMIKILPMFLVILLCVPILDIGGKSIGEFAACFLLGYFVLGMEEVQNRLVKYRIQLGISWLLLIMIRCSLYQAQLSSGFVWDVEQRILSWIGILAIIGLGKYHLEFNSRFTKYFAPAAFPFYFFHQTIVVVTGYFIVQQLPGVFLQYFSIVLISYALTFLMYEICRRITFTRFLFGIKR
ncbi:acyltransferase family protein [Anoxybacterium hadale]|uniref:Acyltransferase family protein n=1 Tax=Anoxybacterium hadale TaxID=3408580 RepID=A0ACD1A6K5_9FIRM|nr:acyltransferase family protein [Clostridiales bacterium]